MQNNSKPHSDSHSMIPLVDFGHLQERYQSLKMIGRAKAVLSDAEPALKKAENILRGLADSLQVKQVFTKIRKNPVISGKMRPSEARDLMLDTSSDFIQGSLRKLAAWRKTIERISNGEGVEMKGGLEYIPAKNPLALAIAGSAGLSNYLSIVQLALLELAKNDKANADSYRTTISEVRRCATILGDYENASGIWAQVNSGKS